MRWPGRRRHCLSGGATARGKAALVSALNDLRLACHGWCARNNGFSATLPTNFDPQLRPVPAVARDLSRVLINVLTNAFYAVTQKSKPAGAGTGLGLSLSYDVITKGHGGALSVESQEGEYFRFTISLPVAVGKELAVART